MNLSMKMKEEKKQKLNWNLKKNWRDLGQTKAKTNPKTIKRILFLRRNKLMIHLNLKNRSMRLRKYQILKKETKKPKRIKRKKSKKRNLRITWVSSLMVNKLHFPD